MAEKRLKINLPLIVEGRYDKTTLLTYFDAHVITTGGFAVFNSKEKQSLIRKLGERGGVILLTDSDGAGKQIRSFLSGILPKEKIHNVYVPEILGKERRKAKASRAGFLGVEGMSREVLVRALLPFTVGECERREEKRLVTKLDFYLDGLSGRDGARERRDSLSASLDLPRGMTADALLEAVNLIYSYEQYKEKIDKLNG